MILHLTSATSGETAATHAAVANEIPHVTLGQMCAAIVSHTPAITGREVFDRLQRNYFSMANMTAFEALKISVNEIREYFLQRDARLDLAVLIFYQGIAYIAVAGNSSATIQRGARIVPLASSTKEEGHFLSGRVEVGDTYSLLNAMTLTIENEPGGVRSQKLRQKLVSVIDALLARLPQKGSRSLRINDPQADVKVHNQRKYAVIFGIFLVALLGISVVIGIKRNEHVQKTRAYKTQLDQIRQTLEEARSLKEVSRDRARALLLDARNSISELEKSELADSELAIVASAVDDSLGSIAGLYKHNPELFLDLSLVSNNFVASTLVSASDAVVVFDAPAKKLVRIDRQSKKTEVLAGPDKLEGVTGIAAYESRVFTLSPQGVIELTKSQNPVIPKSWQGEALIFAFAGNIYLLDKDASQIYRYPGTIDGFGSKANWFATDVNVDLSGSDTWAIDGSIWVLSQNGKISKFSLGKVDSFFLPADIDTVNAMYTDDETEDLYLLDNKNGRIIVVDKKGNFLADYENEQIKEVTTILVDSANKKMILAAGSKLFTLEIRH